LLPDFNMTVKREILIIVFKHLKDIYSFESTNWCVFLSVLCLASKAK
jgi:hypothetical protein